MTDAYSGICSAVCDAAGYSGQVVCQVNGVDVTDAAIAARCSAAYIRQRTAMPPVYGASLKEERKRQRQFEQAYRDDVKGQFKINWWTLAAAVVLGALGGPAGVILAIAATVFEWLLSRDLENHFGDGAFEAAAQAMGVAG